MVATFINATFILLCIGIQTTRFSVTNTKSAVFLILHFCVDFLNS